MQPNPERNSGCSVGKGIGKGDAPRKRRGCAVVAAGAETSDAGDRRAERHGWGNHIGEFPERKFARPNVPTGKEERCQEPAVKYSCELECGVTKDLANVIFVVTPHRDDHQDLCPGDGDEDDPRAVVQYHCRIDVLTSTEPGRDKDSCCTTAMPSIVP